MNWLTSFLPLHTTQALGWTLIHSLWQAGLAALLVAALFALLPRLSAETRAALSYGGMILIVIMAGLTFAGQLGEDSLVPFTRSLLETGTLVSAPATVQSPQLAGLSLSDIRYFIVSWLHSLTGLWLLGVVIAFGRLGRGGWQLRRLRREKHQPVPVHLLKKLNALKVRFNMSRPVRLLAGKRLTTPIVYGHLRPVILFPLALLAEVSPEQIEALLAHELAHIKRHDYLLNLFTRFLRSLLFFNPGFLWLAKAWENEREYCCDKMATTAGVKPICLAEALLGVRERQLALLTLTPAALGRGSLRMRIRRIFGEPVQTQVRYGIGLPALLVLVMAGLWLLGSPRGVTASEFFHGLSDTVLQSTPAPTVEKTPVVWSVSSDEETKKQVEKLEQLQQKIEILRREKQSAKRDAELTRLEKAFISLAKMLVKKIPPPLPPAPVAEVAPVSPVSPVTPLPEIAPVIAVSPSEPPLPAVHPRLVEPVEPARPPKPEELEYEIQKVKRVAEERQFKAQVEQTVLLKEIQERQSEEQEHLAAELKVLEEKQRLTQEKDQAELDRLHEQLSAEHKKMDEEQKIQQKELAVMEKRLAEEQKVFNHFENELEKYLKSQGLIVKSDQLKIEINKKKVLLAGQELSEAHSRAIRELAREILGKVLKNSDSRIVIQR